MKAGTIVNCGLDWVTATFKPDSRDLQAMQGFVWGEVAAAKKRGEESRVRKPQGYAGEGTEHVFWGGRPDGYMLLLSGGAANEFYKELLNCRDDYNITRIDLQVSTKREDATDSFAPRYRAMIRNWEAQEGRNRVIQLGTVDRVTGGDSLTIFPRVSEVHFRIYDKSHEQRGRIAPGITRFEGEFKGDTARTLWGTINHRTNPHSTAKRLLASRLKAVGIKEDWMQKQTYMKLPVVGKRTDNEKRLDYLATVGKSIVDKLREAGLEDEARAALGL